MDASIAEHYGGSRDVVGEIRDRLRAWGTGVDELTPEQLAAIDEFHIRGRPATLDLAQRLGLKPDDHVLDMGSGLGGPARTIARTYGCRVTGIDISEGYCRAANAITEWQGLTDRVRFVHGDAIDHPFGEGAFDAAITLHATMSVEAKGDFFAAIRNTLGSGGRLGVYDVLQGEGGPVHFPVPWARDPLISHLATPTETRRLLQEAGFEILEEVDSSDDSLAWFRSFLSREDAGASGPLGFHVLLGEDFPRMARNQVRNLAERRIRTVMHICRA